MFMDTPDTLLMTAVGALFLGWMVGKIGAYVGDRFTASRRDPRDDRIRSMEAELRVAKSEGDKARAALEERERELAEAREEIGKVEQHLDKSEERIAELRQDLKESVVKTRELREELANRAEENLKSEVKLREVETELSVAHASTDMISTGVLDYSLDAEAEDDHGEAIEKREIQRAGS